jgi:hypothetical protein
MLNLYPQVIQQTAQIAHLERLLHFHLELVNLLHGLPYYQQIIDIDSNNQSCSTT